MKKLMLIITIMALLLVLVVPFVGCSDKEATFVDMEGRSLDDLEGKTFERVVCIGAGALRLYSYIGDVSLLCGVEAIDNTTAEVRPAMFDGVSRPYQMANAEVFNTLPICGKGGPNDQAAEPEKILACNPDIIISEYGDASVANALQETLGIPVVVVHTGSNGVFDEKVTKSFIILGKIFNKQDRANELINYIASEKAAIEEKVKNIEVASQKKVYICGLGNWGTTDELQTAQNYAPFNIAKINNIVTGLTKDGIQPLETEKFMELAPEMDIIIMDAAAVKNIKKNDEKRAGRMARLEATKAWADGEIYLEMAYNAYYTNLEIALINTWFAAKSVYPTEFADVDVEAKTTEITTKFLGKDLNAQIKAKPQSFGGYQKITDPAAFFAI